MSDKPKWKLPKGMILCEPIGPHQVRVVRGHGCWWTAEGLWPSWCREGARLWVRMFIELPAAVADDVGAPLAVRADDVVAVLEPEPV